MSICKNFNENQLFLISTREIKGYSSYPCSCRDKTAKNNMSYNINALGMGENENAF